MRKVVSIGLLFLFIWQLVGFVVYFEFEHYTYKKELKSVIRQNLQHENICVFEMDQAEMNRLIWLNKKEFKLKGELYDVIRMKTLNSGKIFLECLNDTQEKSLFAKLNQAISSESDGKYPQSPSSHCVKLLKTPYLPVYPEKIETIDFEQISAQPTDKYKTNISLRNKRPLTPPPQRF